MFIIVERDIASQVEPQLEDYIEKHIETAAEFDLAGFVASVHRWCQEGDLDPRLMRIEELVYSVTYAIKRWSEDGRCSIGKRYIYLNESFEDGDLLDAEFRKFYNF